MALWIPIPQDIIEEIIVHLVDDLPTLKCCATAAHSLFLATRKHIFSTVRLYQPSEVSKLHSLLDRSPEIAALISTLHIHINSQDILLSIVLPSLLRLRNLVIGHKEHAFLNWREFPQTVQTAIEDLIKSPTLHTLHFTYIFDLPISIIPLAAHVKVLKLASVKLTDRDARHQVWDCVNPMQVESIHLLGTSMYGFVPPLHAPHLRRCTILGDSNHFVLQKIFIATEPKISIKDLTWWEYQNNSYIDPTVLSHLQRLTFDEVRFVVTIAFMWSSMGEFLADVSLNILEEFSVTVRSKSDRYLFPSTSEGDICLGATGIWWDRLDTLLGDSFRVPKLRSVNFSLDIIGGDPSVSDEAFALLIGKQLPSLQRAGILSTRFCRGSAGVAIDA